MMAGPVSYNGVRFPELLEEIIKRGDWEPANRKVAYITLDNEYSRYVDEGFRGNMKEGEVFGLTIPGFPKFGWQEVMHEVAEIGSVEWRPLISKIKKQNPALLVFTDFVTSDEISFLRQFIPSPTNTLIYMAYGPQIPEFIMEGSDVANGIIHSTDVGQVPDEKGLAWEQRFQAKFGRLPGLAVAANLYDEVYLWKAAVEKAGTYEDHAAVAEEIRKINYKGIAGTTIFDPKTHTAEYRTEKFPECLPFLYYQVQGLKQVCVDPKEVAKPFILPPWMKK
jgi:branched-chain amino acid transport system substrate-binding protein